MNLLKTKQREQVIWALDLNLAYGEQLSASRIFEFMSETAFDAKEHVFSTVPEGKPMSETTLTEDQMGSSVVQDSNAGIPREGTSGSIMSLTSGSEGSPKKKRKWKWKPEQLKVCSSLSSL